MSDHADGLVLHRKRRQTINEIRANRIEHFLLRLIARHGLQGAAWGLRALADELQVLANHIARSLQFRGRGQLCR
jgi:hypothetical protein